MIQPPQHERRSVMLKLESIGDSNARSRGLSKMAKSLAPFDAHLFEVKSNRPWVAEITGTDSQYGFKREFLEGQKDYRDANSVGTRGVYWYYQLVEGKVYEVFRHISWRNSERYFCKIEQGRIVKLTKQEVLCAVT